MDWTQFARSAQLRPSLFPWLGDDGSPTPTQLGFYNKAMALSQFIEFRELLIDRVQTWRSMIRGRIREEQTLARYWQTIFQRNQATSRADLVLRREENCRFRRLVRVSHPCFTPRLAAGTLNYAPASIAPASQMRVSPLDSADDDGKDFASADSAMELGTQLPLIDTVCVAGLVPLLCPVVQKAHVYDPNRPGAVLSDLVPLNPSPTPSAPSLAIFTVDDGDRDSARPRPSAPQWPSHFLPAQLGPPRTVFSGLALSGHSLSRYPTGCGPVDSDGAGHMVADCQLLRASPTNLERRSSAFGRHWYDRALADDGSSAEPHPPCPVGSSLSLTTVSPLATAAASSFGMPEAAGTGVGRAPQASPRRRVFDFEDES